MELFSVAVIPCCTKGKVFAELNKYARRFLPFDEQGYPREWILEQEHNKYVGEFYVFKTEKRELAERVKSELAGLENGAVVGVNCLEVSGR